MGSCAPLPPWGKLFWENEANGVRERKSVSMLGLGTLSYRVHFGLRLPRPYTSRYMRQDVAFPAWAGLSVSGLLSAAI